MGSNDVPPPHVPSFTIPVSNILLQIGGTFWTICYILSVRASLRTRSYGMPMFSLALNFSWELVYALFVVEAGIEQVVFTIWLIIDCGMVYSMLKFGKYEWSHAPAIARNIGSVFALLTLGAAMGHWAFAKWWIDNEIGKREGKFYRGIVGPDTTELSFWSAAFCQAYGSAASLCQLLIRQHSGGVDYGVWATRTFGSIIGMYCYWLWNLFFWREAHDYFISPFALFLWGTGLFCDLVYPFVLSNVRKTERVLADGRRVAGEGMEKMKGKKAN